MNSSESDTSLEMELDNEGRNVLLHYSSSDDTSDLELLEEIAGRSRNLRVFRERPDNFKKWNEDEFFVRFRLRKNTVLELLRIIEGNLRTETAR